MAMPARTDRTESGSRPPKQLVRRGVYWLLLFCLLGSCDEAAGPRALKLAHGLPIDHPVHLGMERMAERVTALSEGTLRIDIYPSGQLGSERQALELLQIGSLAMTKVSGAVLENFAPETKVLSLPYVFESRAHAYAFQDSELGRSLLTGPEQYRLRGLAYFDAGFRSYYTKTKPVQTPADLRGQKIRVQNSPSAIALVKATGGAPTPISYGELYTALQQGVVDGAENNPPSFYRSRHYEVTPYYSLNEHTAVPDVLLIGTDAWNRLSAQQRAWLQQAADEAVRYQRELWQRAEAEALDAVRAAGVTVIRPDKGPFIAATRGVRDAFRDDPVLYPLLQQIEALNPDRE